MKRKIEIADLELRIIAEISVLWRTSTNYMKRFRL